MNSLYELKKKKFEDEFLAGLQNIDAKYNGLGSSIMKILNDGYVSNDVSKISESGGAVARMATDCNDFMFTSECQALMEYIACAEDIKNKGGIKS